MGMVMIGCRLSAETLKEVLDDPDRVDTLLFGDLDDESDEEAEMPEPELDLHKWWHGVHFLLTGTEWEFGPGAEPAVLGGEAIGEDGGYGPPRFFRPDQVRTIADGLDALDVAALRARFDPAALTAADIYPTVWDEGTVLFDECLAPAFLNLRRFYRAAADNGEAVLLAIT